MRVFVIGMSLLLGASMAADPKGNATKGKTLYATCMGCHGDKGQGGIGVKLAGVVGSWKFADFKKTLQTGVNPKGKKLAATMPKFASLKDQEIADLQAYIKTFK